MESRKLEDLLEKAVKDPNYRLSFYDEFLKSVFLVLYEPDESDEMEGDFLCLREGGDLRIKEFANDEGRHIIPIFSSLEALRKAVEFEETYIEIDIQTLFENTKGASYILNPFSQYSKEFTPKEIENLLEGKVEHSDEEVNLDRLTVIDRLNPEMKRKFEAIKAYFAKMVVVQEAYLFQKLVPRKDEILNLTMAISIDVRDDATLNSINLAVRNFLNEKGLDDLDLIILEGNEYIKGVKPFFKNSVSEFSGGE